MAAYGILSFLMGKQVPPKRAVIVGVVLVAAALIAALLYYPSRTAAPAAIPIVIAVLKAPHSGLVLIAEANGYFAEEGLNATIKTTLTGHESINAVLKGEADAGVTAETPLARALAEGKQPRVVGTIFISQWNSGVVARKDRGVAHPEDLKGKRIGFVFGTATHYMLETFLAFHGIPLESVSLVNHKADQIVAALVSGEIDAGATWIPYLTQMQQKLGDMAVTFTPKDFYSEMTNLVVGPDYVHRNREATNRLLRALLKAESFAAARPNEAIDLLASALGVEADSLHGHGDPLTYELTLKQALVLATENEVRWYFRREMVPQRPFPDLLQAFETEPLRKLKPASVTIVK